MFNKKLMMSIIFFVLLLLISTISAADTEINDVVSVDNDTNDVISVEENSYDVLSVKNDDSIVESVDDGINYLSVNSDGTFTDLANEINNANGELNLTKNYVYSSSDSRYVNGIVINKEITINGKGFIINGFDKARVFNVTASNVIIKNIEFTGCSDFNSGSGSAINWRGSNGNLYGCNFINCKSLNYGGAVYWSGSGGSLFGCNFINCYSSSSNVKSTTTTSSSSTNSGYGGAVYWSGYKGNLYDCSFNNCYIINSNRNSNTYTFKDTATRSSSSSSSSYSYGGAVCWSNDMGNLFNCEFINCYSSSSSNGNTHTHNEWYESGASSSGSSSSSFSYNGIYWEGDNGNLFDCSFINSSSSYSYGGSYNSANKGHSISYSYSSSYTYGGAVCWRGSNGNLFDCNFINPTLRLGSGSGSGSSTGYGQEARYSNSTDGGAIYWKGNGGNVLNCSLINCHVSKIGFAHGIFWGGNNGNLFNCSFINSSSKYSLTANKYSIYWDAENGHLFNCSFDGNYYDYQEYCHKLSSSTVHPLILIYTSNLNNNDARIVLFESTQLVNNVSVKLYEVSDRKILYDEFDISAFDLTSSLNLNYIDEGEYQIVIEYAGDNFYSASSTNGLFKIGKNSSYEVSVNENIVVGDNATINLTFDEDATGMVKITIDDYSCVNELVGGKTSFNILCRNGGINTYKIKYEGDNKYNPIYITDKFNVLYKSNINLNLKENYFFDENIYLNYTITPNCVGIISIFVDDEFKTNVSVGDMFELENISVGEHNVTVIYNGDEFFSTCKNSIIFTVSKADPSIKINSTDLAGDVLFELILNAKSTGNVTISLNNNFYSGYIINGKTNISIPNLAAGDYNCVILYEGDSNYNSVTQNYNFNLQLQKSAIIINVIDITLGDVVNVEFELTSDATGTMGVYINNTLIKTITLNEKINIPDLAVGSYLIKLVYNGDEFYESCENITTFNVLKIKPNMDMLTVSSTSSNITFGDIVNVNYHITDGVTGYIDVYVDSILNKTVNVGELLTISGLSAGNHNLKLVYTGDENYDSCENNITFEVLKQQIDISNAATIVDAVYGKTKIIFTSPLDGTLNVILSNDYQKSFNILNNSENYLELSDANAGDYEITYNFAPNNKNYQDATYSDSLIILKTLPKFNINLHDINYNQYFKAEITFLSDVTGTMNITLKNEDEDEIDKKINLNLANNVLKYEINKLDVSKYYLTFSYSGNDNYYVSNEQVTFQVFKIDPIIYFDVTNATYGQTAKIIVNSAVDGNVTFKIGSITYNEVLIENNLIIQDIKDIDAGNYSVKITYNGNNNYNAKTYDVKLTINKISTTVTGAVDDITYSETATVNVKASVDGNVIVKIDESYINNINILANTVTPVTFKSIPSGKHNVTITLKPINKNYDDSSYKTDFTVSKKETSVNLNVVDSVYGDDVIVNVTASEDGIVILTVGDIIRERNVLANTVTKFNLGTLAVDSYDVEVSFDAGENYKSSNNNGNIVISPGKAEILVIQTHNNIFGETNIIKVKTNVDGMLSFKLGGIIKSFDIVSNKLTSFDLGVLDAKTYDVEVSLDAGDNYTKPSDTAQITITPKETIVNVNVKDNNYGENIIVNVSASENGKITVQVGTIIKEVNIEANKVYSVNFGILNANSYDVNVTFNAGNNYQESYNNSSLVVSPAQSEITEIQTQNNVYGENSIVKVKTNVDGVLTAKINDISKEVNINAYQLTSIDFGILDANNYELKLIFNAGNNYVSTTATKTFNVLKIDPTISVAVTNATYGQTATIVLNTNADGNATIEIGSIKTYNEVLFNNGLIIQDVKDIDAGNYSVKVTYNGNNNYNTKAYDAKLTINRASTSIVATVDDIAYTENAIINVKGSVDGIAIIKIDETFIKNINILTNIIAPVTFENIPVGKHNVAITLKPTNKNYDESYYDTDFTVSKKETSVNLNVADSVYGDDVIINVTASADGNVILTVGDIIREKNVLANTVAKFNLGVLAADSYDVEVSFDAGSNYKTSNGQGNFIVSPAEAEITSIQIQDNTYGENTIIKVKTNVDGILAVNIDNIKKTFDISANKLTSCDLGVFDAETYSVTMSFDAGSNYTKPTNATKITINPKTTSVDISVEDSVYGDDVIVNVTASEDGQLTIKMGDVVKTVDIKSNEVIPVNLGIFDVNTYIINVTFEGGKNYKSSSKDDSVIISQAKSLITDVQVENSTYGDNIIVKIKTNVDGIVTVKLGETTKHLNIQANNLTSVDFGVLDANNHTIMISLDAGSNYISDNKDALITVWPKNTTVNLDVKEYVTGENIIVNVTASETGKIIIRLDNAVKNINVDANCVVSVDMGTLSSGLYNIDVNFTAGSNYVDSHESVVVKVLSKIDEDDVNITIPEIVANQESQIVINLPSDATGTVTLSIGDNTYVFNVENGIAVVKVPKLEDGNYDYAITYSGDGNYSSFNTSGNIEVSKPIPDIIIPPLDELSADGSVTINLPVGATGTVTLVIDNKPYSFPVNNGIAKIYMPELANGNYQYSLTYSGDGKYSSFTKTGSVNINKPAPKPVTKTTLTLKKITVKKSAKKLTIQATLKVNGKVVKGKIIKFKFNKKTYNAKTNAKGVAKITVKKSVLKKLKKGKKVTYTATYDKITKKVTVKVK